MIMQTDLECWVLEDDKSQQFIYRDLLELRYHLTFFSTLQEFKDALINHPALPDFLIADVRLPDGNFLDFLLNSDLAACITFPFLVISSLDDLDILRLAFNKGATDYLTKPFTNAQLVVKLEIILQKPGKMVTKTQSQRFPEELTIKETEILKVFIEDQRHTAKKDFLLKNIWGQNTITEKTLAVHIFNLKKKLQKSQLDICHFSTDAYQLIGLTPRQSTKWMEEIKHRNLSH